MATLLTRIASIAALAALPCVAANTITFPAGDSAVAITPLGTPFALRPYAYGQTTVLQVLDNGVPIPGCEALPEYIYDDLLEGPPYPVGVTGTCRLPATVEGWHHYVVTRTAANNVPAAERGFDLYTAPAPVRTSAMATFQGATVFVQLTVPSVSPGGGPDPVAMSPGVPEGTVSVSVDGVTVLQPRDVATPSSLNFPSNGSVFAFITPSRRRRHSVVVTFAGANGYASSTTTIPVASVEARDDLDGDGKADILWSNAAGRIAMWSMDGARQLSGRELYAAGSGWSVPLVAKSFSQGVNLVARNDDGRVQFFSPRTGQRSTSDPAVTSGWMPRLAGDFQRIGDEDVVYEHADGRVDVNVFSPFYYVQHRAEIPGGTGWHPAGLADFDASLAPDILWRRDDGASAIWTMNGTLQGGAGALLGPGTGWTPAFTGTFDADTCADILWTHTDGRAAIWIMGGYKQIGGASLLPAGTGFRPIIVADLDGDGLSDIVWERTDGRTSFWLMNGTRQVGAGDIFAAGSGWKLLKMADYNGDGFLDYLAQHTDGRVAIGIFDGVRTFTQTIILPAGTGFSPIVTRD